MHYSIQLQKICTQESSDRKLRPIIYASDETKAGK